MKQKLNKLYEECLKELNNIGINMFDEGSIGKIDIYISKRNNKRYGICIQEKPDETSRYIQKNKYGTTIKYNKFYNHHIQISPWVMNLDNVVIKNTIIHELIHCIPNCNNHGKDFKKYAKYINNKLGYNISRVGNKKEDFLKSNLEYIDTEKYKYKIECQKCGQIIYRKRYNKYFTRKYRCGKCGGKFKVKTLE